VEQLEVPASLRGREAAKPDDELDQLLLLERSSAERPQVAVLILKVTLHAHRAEQGPADVDAG